MNPTTITSKGADGSRDEITLASMGSGTGMIRLRHWKRGAKAPSVQEHKVKNLRASANGLKVQCYAEVPGPDPLVEFDVQPAAVKVKISGAWLGNGTTTYPLPTAEREKIIAFISESKFPAIVAAAKPIKTR